MGLFDGLLGGGGSGGLYGDALTDQQKQALSYSGLLGFLGGMQKSGALDYTVPFISGKVPGGLAAGLAGGMAGMGDAQDKAALNALNAQLVSLKGQDLKSTMAARQKLMEILPGLAGGGGPPTAPPATALSATPTAGGPDTVVPSGTGLDTVGNATPAALVKRYESGGDYNVGFGGTDLSNAPRREDGFPIWEGKQGPRGISHAAGAYQFEPATWAQYAEPLGIKDFSQASQDAVFRAAYLDQGLKPWAPYNPKIAAAIGGGTRPPVQLAAADGNMPLSAGPTLAGATPGAADMSAIPQAAPGTALGVPGMPNATPAAPAGGPVVMPTALPAPPAQAPPGAAVSPPLINGIDPRALAAAGTFAQIGGMGDAVKPLETYYYNSPGYKQAVAEREALGKLINTPQVVRPGTESGFYDANHVWHQGVYNPKLPEGANLARGPNGEPMALPVPGALPLVQQASTAQAAGPATYRPEAVHGPFGQGFTTTALNLPGLIGGGASQTTATTPAPGGGGLAVGGVLPGAPPSQEATQQRPEAAPPTFPVQTPAGTKDLGQLRVADLFPNGQGIPQPPQPPPGATYGPASAALTEQQKKDVDRVEGYAKEAADNQKGYQDLGHLRDILNRGLQTSNLAPLWKDLSNTASGFGVHVNIPNDINDAYAFDKAATDLIFTAVKKMGGKVLVSEIEGFARANPSGVIPRETNYSILNDLLSYGKWQDSRAALAQEYLTTTGGAPLSAFEKKFNEVAPLDTVTEHYRGIFRDLGSKFPGDKAQPQAAEPDKGTTAVIGGVTYKKIGGQWYRQ